MLCSGGSVGRGGVLLGSMGFGLGSSGLVYNFNDISGQHFLGAIKYGSCFIGFINVNLDRVVEKYKQI